MNVEEKRFAEDKHADYAEHNDRLNAVGAGYETSAATKLINPLHGLSKERIFSDVDQFCAETGLTEHNDVFRRGALVAQRPEQYEEITELNEDDLFWLRKSSASKWSHPKMLYFTGKSPAPLSTNQLIVSIRLCYWCCYSRMGSDWFKRC
jgi:hypothetical protein